MLSKKYLAIKKALTSASKIDFLHKKLIVLANMYIDIDKGFRFSYMPDENGETNFIDKLSGYYKENFIYFDVGAHIGTYTDMVVERFDHYKGHLFDVTENTYKKCAARHSANKNLIINNAALSDSIGEIEYRSYPDDPSRNGIAGVRTEGDLRSELLTAPCWTGDDYCEKNNINHIDLLKIDAEGYDLHVIKGFERMITQGNIDVIQFEYNVKHSETHCMLGDFYAYLEEKGYIIGPLRQEGVQFSNFDFTHNNFEMGPNYVACKPELRNILATFLSDDRKSSSFGVEAERERLGYWGQAPSAPHYSVCVCNYNMADTLERAMRSVLDQLDQKLYEVVVIDDGSNDDSLSELEKLAQKYPNFRYIPLPRDPKRRLGDTRNISIRAARGEYVLLHIDADDEWKPYLQDLVTLFHKIEAAIGHDIHLSGQQTGIGKRDLLLKYGPYENLYRCEDRNLMMKLAKEKILMFMDYQAYHTRLSRPIKKKLIKAIWDDLSHMIYDMRQNEPKLPLIKDALLLPIKGKDFSVISRIIRPILILPIYVATRFMPPIINHITWQELQEYQKNNRGTYPEIMQRLGGDPDLSFLSKEAQDIYSSGTKLPGFRSTSWEPDKAVNY